MAKINEIQYPQKMAEILNVPQDAVLRHLTEKPFLDPLRSRYFTDMGQLMGLLPPPDARILDLGAGTGWTSRFLYRCGYAVTALDISPTMVELAKATAETEFHFAQPDGDRLSFNVCDYESPFNFGKFDAAIACGKRIVELAPDDILAHTNLSVFYQRAGRIAEAEEAAAKAKVLDWKKQIGST